MAVREERRWIPFGRRVKYLSEAYRGMERRGTSKTVQTSHVPCLIVNFTTKANIVFSGPDCQTLAMPLSCLQHQRSGVFFSCTSGRADPRASASVRSVSVPSSNISNADHKLRSLLTRENLTHPLCRPLHILQTPPQGLPPPLVSSY